MEHFPCAERVFSFNTGFKFWGEKFGDCFEEKGEKPWGGFRIKRGGVFIKREKLGSKKEGECLFIKQVLCEKGDLK